MTYQLNISHDPQEAQMVAELRYTRSSPHQSIRVLLKDYEDLVVDYIVNWSQAFPLGLASHPGFDDLKKAILHAEEKKRSCVSSDTRSDSIDSYS